MMGTATFWIMIVSGLLTMTMVHAAIAPRAALVAMFGAELQGRLAEIIVSNWAALITLVGVALIYGAIEPVHRVPILVFAGASKLIFIALMLSVGRAYLTPRARLYAAVDVVFVVLFALILLLG